MTLQDLDGGGLTGPVGTEKCKHFTFEDFEVDATDRLDVSVALRQTFDFDGCHVAARYCR